jgi:hypothetical protein
MPIDYRLVYPPDTVEHAVTAEAVPAEGGDPQVADLIQRVQAACHAVGVDHPAMLAAARVALVRMAQRYGVLGDDAHAYHNPEHLLELLEHKLPALLAVSPLDAEARNTLVLFCVCHDLRQRETRRHGDDPVGANEAASVAETDRLLDALGLDAPGLRLGLRLAILGSTFAAGNDDGAMQGAFAHRLAAWLDATQPKWRDDPMACEAEHRARIAADIDTSNVASDYAAFAQSAVALAIEMQHRAGRPLDSPGAGASCLGFLTEGQERYVFELQRFASAEGRAAFGAQRDANALRVRDTGRAVRQRFASSTAPTGAEVIAAFREIVAGGG